MSENRKQMNKLLIIVLTACFFVLTSQAQPDKKIPLDHSVYDGWKTMKNQVISNDGQWLGYEIDPQQGDGFLYV